MRYIKAIALYSLLANQVLAQDKFTKQFYFETDSFNLTRSHEVALLQLEKDLSPNPYYRIRLEGNTDSVGDRVYNIELSKKRIASIRNALIARGLKANRIKVEPKGEDWPVFNNGNEVGKSRNRRVDVFVLMDRDSCFKDGCAQTCIPKGAFDPYFTNEIAITFIPITNVDQMRTNNLSAQTVDGNYLFSSGMIRVTATYKGIPVNPKLPVKLRIPAYRLDTAFTIWEGATAGNSDVNWREKKMEVVRGKGDCQYFEMDGSLINKWINIDKPRPPGNMVCADNPFAYLDMPAVDSDSAKVIENDIILGLPATAFGEEMADVEVSSERVKTLCQMLEKNLLTTTENQGLLGRQKDILHLEGFQLAGKEVVPDMAAFKLYFPASEELAKSSFYTANPDETGNWVWKDAGKADSSLSIEGCSCKYLVKEFPFPTAFVNVGIPQVEKEKEEATTFNSIYFKKWRADKLYLYDLQHKQLRPLFADETGRCNVPLTAPENKLLIIGFLTSGEALYTVDGKLNQFRKRIFKKERVISSKHLTPQKSMQALKLKSISCQSRI